MRAYVEQAYGPWNEAEQRKYYRSAYRPADLQIIQIEEGEQLVDVGMLFMQERTEEIFLAAIEILPPYQRRGIGRAVLQGLMDKATRRGIPVALMVMKANPRARSLYHRLGFAITGETRTHYIMAYYG